MKRKSAFILTLALVVALGVCAFAFTACGATESVSLDKTSLGLTVGESVTLVATVEPEGSSETVWSTSDEKVVTVSDGKVTAIGAGTATVTVKAGDKSATCEVTVANKAVSNAEELLTAVDGAQKGDIILMNKGEYTINRTLMMDTDNVTLTANGDVTIKSADEWTTTDVGQHGLFTVVADNVTLEGFTVKGATKHEDDGHGAGTGSGINVTYKAVSGGQDGSENVVIRNVNSTDNAGCGIIVNSSKVVLENVKTNDNGWGGVNVDGKYANAELTADESCVFGEQAQVYSEDKSKVKVTLPDSYKEVTNDGVTVWTNVVAE